MENDGKPFLSKDVELLFNSSLCQPPCCTCGGSEMNHVLIDVSKDYCRKPCPIVDGELELLWENACKENPRLFNAAKFRLHSTSKDSNGHLVLNIGITDYKEFFCINRGRKLSAVFQIAEEVHKNKHACSGDAIGVSALVLTSDGYIVFIKRALWVGESQGLLDMPGGHAEPEELIKKLGKNVNISEMNGKDVVYELFHSALREVRDEINLPEEYLTWPLLLGVVRDYSVGGKPSCSFFIQCTLSRDEVRKRYKEGGPEVDESTEIVFINVNDLKDPFSKQFEELLPTMAPCATAALYLYHSNYFP